MNFSLQAKNNTVGLTHPTNTTSAINNIGLNLLLLVALYLLLPFQMTASNLENDNYTCGAELEHFSAKAESSCGANDGKILHDPHINAGTKLPYYVKYTYNGKTKKHGPYSNNQDYYIKGLKPGTYKDLTIIDAAGCKKNHGNVTVKAANCETNQTACAPKLTVVNEGSCPVRVYEWLASGDVFKKEVAAGASWSVTTYAESMWRVINTNPDWNNLKYDEHVSVSCADQTWKIAPTYCGSTTRGCSAGLEHFSAIAESSCGANDGKILHDPHINIGTKLPYYVKYTYNGNTKKHGPYNNNQDYYIKGLASGTYSNLTIIDANGCEKNHGNVTVKKADCQVVDPVDPVSPVDPVTPTCNLSIDAGQDVSICKGDEIKLNATASGIATCSSSTSCSRTVSNTTQCNNGEKYVFYLATDSEYRHYQKTNNSVITWEENNNGTIRYTAKNLKATDGSGEIVSLDFVYSGKRTSPDSDGIKDHHCLSNFSSNGWVYYTKLDGKITSNKSGKYKVARRGQAYQMGKGANATSSTLAYGASGWFSASGSKWTKGDVNIMLSQTCTPTNTSTTSEAEYIWSNGEKGSSITVNDAGTYSVRIKDCNGCEASDEVTVTITDPQAGSLSAASTEVAFNENGTTFLSASPNGDATVPAGYLQKYVLTFGEELVIENLKDTPEFEVTRPGKYTIHSFVFDPATLDLAIVAIGQTTGFNVNDLLKQGGGNICASLDVAGAMIMVPAPACFQQGGDADGDGVCDNIDCDANDPNLPQAEGTACDDSDNNTINDAIQADGCSCVGEAKPACFDFGGDADGDGICADEDCDDDDPNFPQAEGTACNDGDNNTINDAIQADGCSCIGEAKPACFDFGGDADGDGVCADEDCDDNDPNLPATVGSACDDGDANTINDAILEDGCECKGSDLPMVVISDVTVNEDDGLATLDICIDVPSENIVTVRYTTSNGSAIVGDDYKMIDGVARINPGETCTEVTFPIFDDKEPEATEEFEVNVTAPSNATILDDQGIVTILDTDPVFDCKDLEANIGDACDDGNNRTENDKLNANCECEGTIVYDCAALKADIGDTCDDGDANTDNDRLNDNCECEGNQIYDCASLAANIGNTCDDGNANTIDDLVTDDCQCKGTELPKVIISDVTVNEEDGLAKLDICIDAAFDNIVTVRYTTANGSAIVGDDFKMIDGVATILAGETCTEVTFPIFDDKEPEATEEFVVNVTAPSNGVILDDQGIVTILDTDPVFDCKDLEVNIGDACDDGNDRTANDRINANCACEGDIVYDCSGLQADFGDACDDRNANTENDRITNNCKCEGNQIYDCAVLAANIGDACDDGNANTIDDLVTDDCQCKGTELPKVIISDVTVNEEDGLATLDICIDAAFDNIVTVRYTTANGSAIVGDDFKMIDGVATILAGETCTQVTFPIFDDSEEEATEEFVVNITAPSNGVILDNQGIVTILDTDKSLLSINDVVVNEEDGTASLEICLEEVTSQFVYVKYTTEAGDALAGSDYSNQSSFAFISEGQQCTTITLNIIDNEEEEAEESFKVILSNPFNAEIADEEGIVTILDTDKPAPISAVVIGDVTVNEEDGLAKLDICIDIPSENIVTVRYTTSNGSAIVGDDYKMIDGVARINPGETCTEVTFPIFDDSNEEATEEFVVTITAPSNATIADDQGTVTILDTDQPVVVPAISVKDATVFEDEGTATVEICLDQVTANDVSVKYLTNSQSALTSKDFQYTEGAVTILAGDLCAEITVAIIDDREDENDEQLLVNLVVPANATIADGEGTIIIIDNDDPIVIAPVLPNLTISDVTVHENETFAHLKICLDIPSTTDIALECITVNGTAIGGEDFFEATDELVIPAGQECYQVSFKIKDDNRPEPTESFFVELTSVVGANIIDNIGEITILDDDETPVCPELNATGDVGTITVNGLLAPVEIVQIFNASKQLVFQCMNNCDEIEIIENLPAGEYTVIINCYNGSWSLLCREEIAVTVTATQSNTTEGCPGNITNGGRIVGQESLCGAYDPTVIGNDLGATGGAEGAEIEYLWLASTKGCPDELVDQIPGSTSPSYDPGTITETTYFIRCSRRKGCNVWVESNCIVKEVLCGTGNAQEDESANSRSAMTTTNNLTTKKEDKTILSANTGQEEETNKTIQLENTSSLSDVEISVFPNPVVDQLSINLSSLAGQAGTLYLSNNVGQVVKELKVNTFETTPVQLQMGQYPSGLYHLTIVANGQLITTKKVMIQQR